VALTSGPTLVIALHCSGSIGQQWRGLTERLGRGIVVQPPDLFGTELRGHWPGKRPFSLAEEAAPILELINRAAVPVHLVGHSYGGGALHIAFARPARARNLDTPVHVIDSLALPPFT
jgi:pimeloyl-ACP methyl ester carboxylesterase